MVFLNDIHETSHCLSGMRLRAERRGSENTDSYIQHVSSLARFVTLIQGRNLRTALSTSPAAYSCLTPHSRKTGSEEEDVGAEMRGKDRRPGERRVDFTPHASLTFAAIGRGGMSVERRGATRREQNRGERLDPAEGDVRGRVPISSHSEVTVHLSPPWKSAGGSMSAEVAKQKAICIHISIPLRWGQGPRLPHRAACATGSAGATSID
ncbi:hypothetical protein EYF80_017850 [Liparis tanakae]|uniref:Uncharacterized protein n=1 Tax=Liparis tanakae TaxID=230148 RepID=A0A4Z2I3N1_9TELE|nr:hypothetical protein EYF80_017850 [Liparis tanakae]